MNHTNYFNPIIAAAAMVFGSLFAQESQPWKSIDAGRVLEAIKTLSSNEYEGRAPATKGEELTTQFIEQQFKEIGLQPGNPDGSYIQKVPMVGITADPSAQLVVTGPLGAQMTLKYGNEFVAFTRHEEPRVSVDAELVFVGYGIVAPEYNWDDYKGVDVRGKIIVVLVNDPPVPDPNDPTKLDEQTFKGKAMTYYGRWTYKYEISAQKGAAGCLIVHQTEPAGYPWRVVQNSFTSEEFCLATNDRGMSRSAIEGWITIDKAKELFALASQDFDTLARDAISRDFVPVHLGMTASLTLTNTIRTIDSKNVVAKIEGTDLKDECVIYTAHWDHMGIGPEVNGDKIYHGAVDNASGVAGMLEVARAYSQLPLPPRRSILFIATTAEERGLLGTEYYAKHPLYPLSKTLADLNIDELNVLGPARGIIVAGLGQSDLDDLITQVAAEQGREIHSDFMPEKGCYYRGDQLSFAKQGVPALFPIGGFDYVGKSAAWEAEMTRKFWAEDYHQPSDQVKPYWDLSGAVEDLQLLGEVGYRIANANECPQWKEGSEFKAPGLFRAGGCSPQTGE